MFLILCTAVILGVCGMPAMGVDNQQSGNLSSFTTVQAAATTASPIKMQVIISGTGGDVTKNYYINKNLPKTQLANQIISLSKKGTPMITIGNGSGPKVLIVAGVHGNELPAPIAAMWLINYFNGKKIKGTIYIIPFVAPSSTAKNTRYWNGKNLNSVANVPGTPTNRIVNLAKQLKVNAVADFHSTQPGGVPGKTSALCTKIPTYESYNIAAYISRQTGSALIADTKAGVAYPGAVEDVTNLVGIPAVTCEVRSPHGIVGSGSLDKSYSQMLAFLRYEKVV